MSENASFTVIFVSNERTSGYLSPDVYLNLEQIDLNGEGSFQGCAGQCMNDSLFSDPIGAASRYIDCSQNCIEENCDPNQRINIKVTKKPQDLPYRLETSYGSVGGKTVEHDNFAESFDINLDDTLEVKTELSSVRASWEGNIYDQNGSIMAKPPITYDKDTRTLSWGGALVVGTIRVTGMELFDVWSLTVPPRTDSTTESAWSATVRAFFMDGATPKVETLNISEPELDGTCGQNYNTSFKGSGDDDDEDEDEKEEEKCWKRTIIVDPCTGEVKSDTLSQVACPEDEDE